MGGNFSKNGLSALHADAEQTPRGWTRPSWLANCRSFWIAAFFARVESDVSPLDPPIPAAPERPAMGLDHQRRAQF